MSTAEAADKLVGKVAALGDLSRDALAERWAAIYGCPAPPGVRRELLAYAAAWHAQAKTLGALSADTRKLLKRAVAKVERRAMSSPNMAADHGGAADASNAVAAARSPSVPPSGDLPAERRSLVTGARLLRDWNGRTHVVDVMEGGFLYDGRQHRSLSAIAKLITGAHWSGPRFFGLLP